MTDKNALANIGPSRFNMLFQTVDGYIEQARAAIQRSINQEMIRAY